MRPSAVAKGEVYLENDKQERKATGSYYTPDYIVKYIVQHTVGPVLERKLADCEPRLRDCPEVSTAITSNWSKRGANRPAKRTPLNVLEQRRDDAVGR